MARAIAASKTAFEAIEALFGALARDERRVGFINVRSHQAGGFGIGARHDQRRHAHDVRGEARGVEGADEAARGHKDLAAQVAALLFGGELVLEMHRGRPGLDHRLHQFESVERAAETRFGVGDDGNEIVDLGAADLPCKRSMVWIWSARCNALLIRRTTEGTLSTG